MSLYMDLKSKIQDTKDSIKNGRKRLVTLALELDSLYWVPETRTMLKNLHPKLNDDEIEKVIDCLIKIYELAKENSKWETPKVHFYPKPIDF